MKVLIVSFNMLFLFHGHSQTIMEKVGSPQRPTDAMVSAAQSLINTLDVSQKEQALFSLNNVNRTRFAVVPKQYNKAYQREGLKLSQMSDNQKKHVMMLLDSALSKHGTQTIEQVRSINEAMKGRTAYYDRDNIFLSIYGVPETGGTWAWSFEGYHISLNITILNGRVISLTPCFLGTNTVKGKSPLKGQTALKMRNKLALQLIGSLTEQQSSKARAVTKDEFTKTKSKISRYENSGLLYEEMNDAQKELTGSLITQYAGMFRSVFLDGLEQSPRRERESLRFVWFGEKSADTRRYYRLTTQNHLIEWSNHGNHPHTCWRSFDGDFGQKKL